MSAKNIARLVNIFVAWPLDVEADRDQVEAIIKNLQNIYLPRGLLLEMLDWRRSVPAGAGNPETIIINTIQPSNWDIFIGILWKRFGSPPGLNNPKTGQPYASGFEFEYEQAHALWEQNERPHLMLYRCTRSIPPDTDVEQLKLVQQFFQGIEKRYEVLYKRYDALENFAAQLTADLTAVLEKIIQKITQPEIETISASFPYSKTFEDKAEQMDFFNRENELKQIQELLQTHPETSVMVSAPTGMGKSRLLQKLQEELRAFNENKASPLFHCLQLDCRHDEGIGGSTEKLVAAMCKKLSSDTSIPESLDEVRQHLRIKTIDLKAKDQQGKQRRLIIFLDGIELMSSECLVFLRHELLPDLRQIVQEPNYYPAIIAFGRVHPREWRGKGSVHFQFVPLSPFDKDIIDGILRREADKQKQSFPNETFGAWAESIMKISHGHPRCIANLVSWLSEKQHLAVKPSDLEDKKTFLNLILPVIEREILSEDNLAPLEPLQKRNTMAKYLREFLPYVCVFRLYSQAQLRILAYCGLIDENRIDELEEQLSRTFLIDQSVRQLWFEPHQVVRRLLADTLFYQRRKDFVKINEAACKFYDEWITGKIKSPNLLGGVLQDHHKVYYIVESLYHHCRAGKSRKLNTTFEKLRNRYIESLDDGIYPIKRLTELLLDIIREDDDLLQFQPRLNKQAGK